MRKIVLAVVLLLPVLLILSQVQFFPFIKGAEYSDLAVSHYPNAVFLQQSLLNWRQIPLWSPAILSGYPFAANPLAGLYYLPGLLALLFPLPAGFNIIVAVHLVFGGVGIYMLLRKEGLTFGPALLGALAFEAMPKVFSHYGAGHLTMVYAVPWTPWLLYSEKHLGPGHRLRWLLPGAILGVIVLADVRWAAYAGLLWLAYSLRNWAGWGHADSLTHPWHAGRVADWIFSRGTNLVFAALVGSPVLLPLAEFTALSTRALLTPQEQFILSLPPGQLFGFIYPYIGGMAEWVLYPGAVGFMLVVYALSMPLVRQRTGFWLVTAGLTIVFALGSNIPLLELAGRLPGFDLLRVPPRMLFLTGLCFAVIGAYALQNLYGRIEGREWARRDLSGLTLFGTACFGVLFGAVIWVVVDQPQTRMQFAWGALALLPAAILVLLARSRRISSELLTIALVCTNLVDLLGVSWLSLEFRSTDEVLRPGYEAAEYIRATGGKEIFRVYSPSYSIPQQTAAVHKLELADGVDPLQLQAYAAFMEKATGVPAQGYSVTLPPFTSGDPEVDNATYPPDPRLLGLLNVRYIVTEYPLEDRDLTLLARFGKTRVYHNMLALPRAWVQPPDASLGTQIKHEPWLIERPNWIILKAKGPGLLVLSELAYPGWQVYVDEQRGEVVKVANLLRGVELSAGEHLIEFVFHPYRVYVGLGLSLAAWLALALVASVRRKRYA